MQVVDKIVSSQSSAGTLNRARDSAVILQPREAFVKL